MNAVAVNGSQRKGWKYREMMKPCAGVMKRLRGSSEYDV